jgi:hypothetical protein
VSRPDLAAASFEDLCAAIGRKLDALVVAPVAPATPALLEESAVAKYFGVEVKALAAARRRGELATHRVGRRVMLDLAAVEAFIRARGNAPPRGVTASEDGVVVLSRVRRVGGRS